MSKNDVGRVVSTKKQAALSSVLRRFPRTNGDGRRGPTMGQIKVRLAMIDQCIATCR